MSLLHSGSTASDSKLYPEDVFSTYLYTGNGSTQTINNGIDLAGKGGLVWVKKRSAADSHALVDTTRGGGKVLESNSTAAEYAYNANNIPSFTSSGFNTGVNYSGSGATYASWTFRKAPKFFDVVTYTGDGVAGRQIPHNLGAEVGMMFIKRVDSTGSWIGYAKSINRMLLLNLTNAAWDEAGTAMYFGNGTLPIVPPSTSNFTVSSQEQVNQSGGTYVAYLFAHDTTADGIIQCGSFSAGSSVDTTITLGFEPQFLMIKASSTTGNWTIIDSVRGIPTGTLGGADDSTLSANLTNAENIQGLANISSTGFAVNYGGGNQTYIYIAIRRPMKTPTSGTQVYNAIARTGTGVAATVTGVGFAPDYVQSKKRATTSFGDWAASDRLRGNATLFPSTTGAESVTSRVTEFGMDGISIVNNQYINNSGDTYINHFFKRAPGFFDVVCYTGTGSATTVAHNLGVAPELMIVKSRNQIENWSVYHAILGGSARCQLQSTAAVQNGTFVWNYTAPTSTVFSVGTGTDTNNTSYTYVAYLFATLAGISKVGSYTGNGTSQTINCGFSTGSRFILIKRTDSTGDWYVWDTVRGIVAANDPHLSLNTTAAEVTTDDSVDPAVEGFVCNQNTTTNINVLNATYIFLAVS